MELQFIKHILHTGLRRMQEFRKKGYRPVWPDPHFHPEQVLLSTLSFLSSFLGEFPLSAVPGA